jgi:hypothetical protein
MTLWRVNRRNHDLVIILLVNALTTFTTETIEKHGKYLTALLEHSV